MQTNYRQYIKEKDHQPVVMKRGWPEDHKLNTKYIWNIISSRSGP